jgi:hypothetical protein
MIVLDGRDVMNVRLPVPDPAIKPHQALGLVKSAFQSRLIAFIFR